MKEEIESDLSFGGPCFFKFFIDCSRIKGSLGSESLRDNKQVMKFFLKNPHSQTRSGNLNSLPCPKVKNMNTSRNNSEFIFISYLPRR